MNAKEAREKAKIINENKASQNRKEVINLINEQSELGYFEAHPDFYIMDSVIDRLIELGYKISQTPDERNGIDTVISWKDESI